MKPFLAYVLPVNTDAHPDQGLPGGPPVGIWPSPGHPAHPIAPGGPPPGYWGGVAPPHPDQGLPGQPPTPSHPIVIPPDGLGDGTPTHPIVLPPPASPTHPIVIPPEAIGPPGTPGVPTHPIQLPPLVPSHPIATPPDYILVWSPGYGYVWVYIGGKPDQSLPGAPPKPDQSLPGAPPTVQPVRR